MNIHDLAFYSCLIIPLITLIIIIIFIILVGELRNKDIKEKIKEAKFITLFTVLIVCFILLSLSIYSYYIRYVAYEPYDGWYEYEVYIEYNDVNKINIEFDLPLPHDSRIYFDLKFFKSHRMANEVDNQSQYLEYSFNTSDYGEVLHIITNDTIFIYSTYDDRENAIDPSLKLSTQDGNIAHVNLSSPVSINCSLWLWYEHTWSIGQGLSFDTYTHYLSISGEPFHVPDRIPDYDVNEVTDIYSKNGAELSVGENQLRITRDEYHMLE